MDIQSPIEIATHPFFFFLLARKQVIKDVWCSHNVSFCFPSCDASFASVNFKCQSELRALRSPFSCWSKIISLSLFLWCGRVVKHALTRFSFGFFLGLVLQMLVCAACVCVCVFFVGVFFPFFFWLWWTTAVFLPNVQRQNTDVYFSCNGNCHLL